MDESKRAKIMILLTVVLLVSGIRIGNLYLDYDRLRIENKELKEDLENNKIWMSTIDVYQIFEEDPITGKKFYSQGESQEVLGLDSIIYYHPGIGQIRKEVFHTVYLYLNISDAEFVVEEWVEDNITRIYVVSRGR